MAGEWYYSDGDAQQGPVSELELQRLAQSGALHSDDLVWCEGMADWTAAGSIPGLLPSAPPPLPVIAGDVETHEFHEPVQTAAADEDPDAAARRRRQRRAEQRRNWGLSSGRRIVLLVLGGSVLFAVGSCVIGLAFDLIFFGPAMWFTGNATASVSGTIKANMAPNIDRRHNVNLNKGAHATVRLVSDPPTKINLTVEDPTGAEVASADTATGRCEIRFAVQKTGRYRFKLRNLEKKKTHITITYQAR